MERVFIAIAYLGIFRDKVVILSRKATRLGLAPVEYVITDKVVDRTGYRDDGRSFKYRAVAVELQSVEVYLDGWEFVGEISPAASGENVLTTLSDEREIPDNYRHRPSDRCDHCGYNRKRKSTFVLYNEKEDKWIQVGSTCLKDFFPGQSPAAIAYRVSLMQEIKEIKDRTPLGNMPGDLGDLHIEDYLSHVCADIRCDGWRSRGEYRDESSADAALYSYEKALRRGQDAPEGDRRKAKLVAAWLRTELPSNASSEYERNLVALGENNAQVCRRKHAGLLASAVVAYDRAQAQKARLAAQAAGGGGHFGEKGEKVTFTAKVERVGHFEGYYGPTTVLNFRRDDGSLAVWFASGSKDVATGDTYSVTGTVKKHDRYQGEAQTIITRCRLKAVA